MNQEEYRKKIEREILEIIEEKLKAGQMNAQRAKEIAQYILDTLRPNMNIDQINSGVVNFDKHFQELLPVIIRVSNEYDENVKKVVTKHIGNLLKQHRIDEADELIKKALNREIKLEE